MNAICGVLVHYFGLQTEMEGVVDGGYSDQNMQRFEGVIQVRIMGYRFCIDGTIDGPKYSQPKKGQFQ